MATRRTVLEVDVTSDASDAVKSFENVGTAASDMGTKVSKSVTDVEVSTKGLDGAADSADNLASKSSQATGGLGALASGMSLVGAEKYAAGLEAAAMATDFFSGVGDIANLVLQSSAVAKVKDAAASALGAVKTAALTVATGAQTAAQWALNAAMSANPITLVVIAVVALVAVLVILYKKSDTVRNIVNKMGAAVVSAFKAVGNAVASAVSWFRDKLPAAGNLAKTLIVTYIKVMTLPLRTLITVIQNVIGWVKQTLPGAFATAKDRVSNTIGRIKDLFSNVGDAFAKPFQTALDIVQDLIDWIGRIKFPSPPKWLTDFDVNPFNKTGGKQGGSGFGGGGTVNNVYITVQGAVDPASTVKQLSDLLNRQTFWNGTVVTVGP